MMMMMMMMMNDTGENYSQDVMDRALRHGPVLHQELDFDDPSGFLPAVTKDNFSKNEDLAVFFRLPMMQELGVTASPILQSIQISLQGLLSLKRVNSTSWFGIISKFANGAYHSYNQLVDQNWPWNCTLRNTTGDRSPARLALFITTP
ncbi:hypothetical protein WISP_16727 [Willisornis vidua]|uniref:Uncharacterized protein n=1 Tax=Willisornis vidua TaxID=1566151 RepID=A0ABQ9DQD8_9PASS|nr:hypothetical protein WISP_16727 [Willisornis vidua]